MARHRIIVLGGPTDTAATSTISLGTLDLTAVPGGIGSLTALDRWTIVVRSRIAVLHNGGDHGSKCWEKSVAVEKNTTSGGTNVGTIQNGNGATNGELIANGTTPPSGTLTWDISSNVLRFRVTPAASTAMKWMAQHDVEILIP